MILNKKIIAEEEIKRIKDTNINIDYILDLFILEIIVISRKKEREKSRFTLNIFIIDK